MGNWNYINCIKAEKYNSSEDIKSIDEIIDEINEIVTSLLKEENEVVHKLTKF